MPRHRVSASSKQATAWLVSPAAAALRPIRAANVYREASTSVPARVQPAPSVTTMPSPRVRRSDEIWVCRALSAVRGGSSPQSNSISVSAETTEPLCNPSIVRMARGLGPGL